MVFQENMSVRHRKPVFPPCTQEGWIAWEACVNLISKKNIVNTGPSLENKLVLFLIVIVNTCNI